MGHIPSGFDPNAPVLPEPVTKYNRILSGLQSRASTLSYAISDLQSTRTDASATLDQCRSLQGDYYGSQVDDAEIQLRNIKSALEKLEKEEVEVRKLMRELKEIK